MFSLQRGDCLDLMPRLPDHSIDLILCDLPYGVTQNKEDVRIPFDLLWAQYTRLIKDRGVIALFGQGLFYVDLVDSNRKLFRYDLIWDKVLKTGFLNANRMPLRQHEQIAIFYKKLPVYHPQFTEGEPLHGKGTAYKNKAMDNLIRRKTTERAVRKNIPPAFCVYRNHIQAQLCTAQKSRFRCWSGLSCLIQTKGRQC